MSIIHTHVCRVGKGIRVVSPIQQLPIRSFYYPGMAGGGHGDSGLIETNEVLNSSSSSLTPQIGAGALTGRWS
jgi:hypothetical protein